MVIEEPGADADGQGVDNTPDKAGLRADKGQDRAGLRADKAATHNRE